MRITIIDLQCEDIMWFAVDSHDRVFACTSAGEGNVPEFVCKSHENVDVLEDFFLNKLPISTQAKHCIHIEKENQLINDFMLLSQKGVFCFDSYIDGSKQRRYKKITAPVSPIFLDELPYDIRGLLAENRVDVDVENSSYINVPHAY